MAQPSKKNTPKKSNSKSAAEGSVRLQKILAEAGHGSRRQCELLIVEGRVQVGREIVSELGVKVDPNKQDIFVDGRKVKIQRKRYFVINKPAGVLSTSWDPSGRTRVIDLIDTNQRVYLSLIHI